MNQPGIFDEIVQSYRSIWEDFPDQRTGKNKHVSDERSLVNAPAAKLFSKYNK